MPCFVRRGLSLMAAVLLVAGLGSAPAGAARLSASGSRGAVLQTRDPHGVTLAQRRAAVRGDLAAADGIGWLKSEHPSLTTRRLTASQLRGLARLAAGSGRMRGGDGRLSPATFGVVASGSCLPCSCGTGTSACSADFVVAGPGGPLDWNIYAGEPALPGYPSLQGFAGGAALSPGETLTATAAIYTNAASNQQVDVSWQVACLGSDDDFDLGSVSATMYRWRPGRRHAPRRHRLE